jgi:RHS repeat-associated protein
VDNGQAVSWSLDPSATDQTRSWANLFLSGATAAESGGSPNPSVPPTGCSTARPVNCATGDFWHTFVDAAVPARGLPLGMQRTYDLVNSQTDSRFGFGWHDSLDMRVTRSSGRAVVTQENGSVLTYTEQPDGSWASADHVLAAFACAPGGECTLTRAESGVQYVFAAAGMLTGIRSMAGEGLQLGYDGDGRLASISHGGAGRITFTWSGSHISSLTDPAGRTTRYGYDASGDLTTVTLPGGARWTFAYDGDHHLLTMTDPRGRTTENTFDTAFRVVGQKQPTGGVTTFDYAGDPASAAGGTTTVTDERGVETRYEYRNMLLVGRTAEASGFSSTTYYTYDLVTLRLVRVYADGIEQESLYDGTGRLVGSTDTRGHLTTFTYDGPSHRRASVTTPMGVTTTAAYDELGRLTRSTSADGLVTTYTYGDPDHPADVTATTVAGRTTRYTYDAIGNLVHSEVADSAGTVVLSHKAFDASGVPYCSIAPARYVAGVRCPAPGSTVPGGTTVVLDAAGRPSVQTGPSGSTTSYTYDAAGSPLTVTDELGRVTTFGYDAVGRTVSVRRGAGTTSASTMTTTYDIPAGEGACPSTGEVVYCQSTSDGRRTTVQGFNAESDVASFTRPGRGTRTYRHVGSRVVEQTADDGTTVTYGYDGDLLTDVSYPDGDTPDVGLQYDDDGRRIAMTDGTGRTDYEYDTAGRLAAVTTPNGTVRGAYDTAGLLGTITYPGGEQVTRSYDAAARLSAVQDWSGRRTAFKLDDNGAVLATDLPNGRTISSTYDVRGDLSARSVGGTALSIGVTRDAAGRVTTMTETGLGGAASSTVSYDALGQLAAVGGVANASDVAGNPTTVHGMPQTFDDSLAVTAQDPATAFTTTERGERADRTGPDGSRITYAYDDESRLTELWSVAGPQVTGLSAGAGPAIGGDTVTIAGSGFVDGAEVWFGSRPAATTVTSSTSATAVVPAGSGAVDVTVRTPVGRSAVVPAGRYTYQRPAVTSLTPATGIAAGGQAVVIRGWNLTGASAVKFGTRTSTFRVDSAEQITATAPAGTSTAQVVVTTPQGTSATGAASAFTYRAEPIITSVSPPAGRTAGGTTVTVRGANLTGVTAVRFGTRSATKVRVSSSTALTAVAPSGTSVVHVTATSAKGTSAVTNADVYGYAAGPAVTSVSPTTVRSSGGTAVTITGTGFTTSSVVKVGSVTATRTYVSATTLKAVVPAGSTTAQLTVRNGTAVSPAIPKTLLTYVRPAVTALSLTTGPAAGGQRIALSGSRFTGATKVLFGSVPGTALSVASSSRISVTAPAGSSTVDVTVVTPEGTSLPAPAGRYAYTTAPIVTGLSSPALRPRGGETFTLTGWNLGDVTEVAFGATRVATVDTSATTATVTTPAGSGAVTVTAYAGTTASSSPTAQRAVYGTVDERYTYDGDGLRQSTTAADGTVTPTVWDPYADQPAMLVHGDVRLVNGPGDLPIAQVSATDTPLYYLHDSRGSTRALLDGSGGTAATLAYTAYGRIAARTGTMPVVGYAGGVADPTGLVHLRHRYLDPTTGTFLTVDPAVDMTGQPYSYAGGDPLNAVDRQGLWPTVVIGAIIGAAIGTVVDTVSYVATTDDFSWRGLGGAAAKGLVSGGITGACMGSGAIVAAGTAAVMACGALGGAAGSIVDQAISKGSVDWTEVGVEAGFGAVAGGLGNKLAARAGQDVTAAVLNRTTGRWGGLKASNLVHPGVITRKFYASTLIGKGLDVGKALGGPAGSGLYRYLVCDVGI